MIKPVGDRVLIQELPHEEKTIGGVYLPDSAQQQYPQEGVVLAVGPGPSISDTGKKLTPIEVEPGDHILFTKYGRSYFKHGDKEYIMIRKMNIYAKIECDKRHPVTTYKCPKRAESIHQTSIADAYTG